MAGPFFFETLKKKEKRGVGMFQSTGKDWRLDWTGKIFGDFDWTGLDFFLKD